MHIIGGDGEKKGKGKKKSGPVESNSTWRALQTPHFLSTYGLGLGVRGQPDVWDDLGSSFMLFFILFPVRALSELFAQTYGDEIEGPVGDALTVPRRYMYVV